MKVFIAQSCLTLCDIMDWSPPGSSVHGILQARTLEWAAIPFPRGSSQPGDWTWLLHCLCLVIIKMFGSSHSVRPPKGVAQVITSSCVARSVLWGTQASQIQKRTKRCDSWTGQLFSPFRVHPCFHLVIYILVGCRYILLLRMLRCINHAVPQIATLTFLFAAMRKEMLQRTAAKDSCNEILSACVLIGLHPHRPLWVLCLCLCCSRWFWFPWPLLQWVLMRPPLTSSWSAHLINAFHVPLVNSKTCRTSHAIAPSRGFGAYTVYPFQQAMLHHPPRYPIVFGDLSTYFHSINF